MEGLQRCTCSITNLLLLPMTHKRGEAENCRKKFSQRRRETALGHGDCIGTVSNGKRFVQWDRNIRNGNTAGMC